MTSTRFFIVRTLLIGITHSFGVLGWEAVSQALEVCEPQSRGAGGGGGGRAWFRQSAEAVASPPMAIASFSLVAIDCPDPHSLAEFYSAITGWRIGHVHEDWVQLDSDSGATIAFQRVENYVPPVWPGSEHPQQLHIDFDVTDLDEGEARVLAAGARKTPVQPGTSWRVYLDPAGHPFCLVKAEP